MESKKLASIDQDPGAEFGQSNDKEPLKGMGHSSETVRLSVGSEPQLEIV